MLKCSITGCDKEANGARGYCRRHYSNWQRHGNPEYKRVFKKDLPCTVEGCERKQFVKGLCNAHHMKVKRTCTLQPLLGTPEAKQKWLDSRLTELSKLDTTRDPSGRGFLAINVVNDITYKARKRGIAWELTQVETYKLIIADCTYCGYIAGWPTTRNGIDRVDNHVAYKADNCVSCCNVCNTAKAGMTLEEFIAWVKRVHAKLAA